MKDDKKIHQNMTIRETERGNLVCQVLTRFEEKKLTMDITVLMVNCL